MGILVHSLVWVMQDLDHQGTLIQRTIQNGIREYPPKKKARVYLLYYEDIEQVLPRRPGKRLEVAPRLPLNSKLSFTGTV